MPKQSITMIKIGFAVFCVGLLAASLTATPCWGADKVAANATITLDVKNEPLRSVLGKITKATRWKIKVPDKWMDKPVTQTLNKVTLEEGLRSVLNNAGVENLLLMYDEKIKVVTLFDTESSPRQSADRFPAQAPAQTPAQVNAQPPVVSATDEPDPILKRAAERAAGHTPARVNRRARRQSSEDD